MTKWVLGLLAVGAVTAAATLLRSPPAAGPVCALPPPAEPAPEPPAAAPVVDVVDLEREFDRAARADEPFVPFDPPTAPPPRPVR